MQDDALFARNFAQLKAYYTDLKSLLPRSQQEHPLLGLNLLRLLAQNRIAEFHIELELLDADALKSPHVDFPRQLERQLMEGLYDRLYGAMEQAPSAHMRCFVTQLQATVRAELATCAAAVRFGEPLDIFVGVVYCCASVHLLALRACCASAGDSASSFGSVRSGCAIPCACFALSCTCDGTVMYRQRAICDVQAHLRSRASQQRCPIT